MNGVHDMGGMQGLGSLDIEDNEPVFHESWEGRVYAFNRVLAPWGRGRNWGSFRYALESIPGPEYLTMSYYERWFTVHEQRALSSGLVTRDELENGHADANTPVPQLLDRSPSTGLGVSRLEMELPTDFAVGQQIRVKELNPPGHIRLPRYTRGKLGAIYSDNGVYASQDTDTNGQRLGDFPQHVFTVKFSSRELWGDAGHDKDSIFVDMWEDYIEAL
jgi:nitrile hydratase